MLAIYMFAGIASAALIYRLGYIAGRRNGHYEAGCRFGKELSTGMTADSDRQSECGSRPLAAQSPLRLVANDRRAAERPLDAVEDGAFQVASK